MARTKTTKRSQSSVDNIANRMNRKRQAAETLSCSSLADDFNENVFASTSSYIPAKRQVRDNDIINRRDVIVIHDSDSDSDSDSDLSNDGLGNNESNDDNFLLPPPELDDGDLSNGNGNGDGGNTIPAYSPFSPPHADYDSDQEFGWNSPFHSDVSDDDLQLPDRQASNNNEDSAYQSDSDPETVKVRQAYRDGYESGWNAGYDAAWEVLNG